MVGIDIAQFMVIACDLNTSDIDVPVCKNLVESMKLKLICFIQFYFHVISSVQRVKQIMIVSASHALFCPKMSQSFTVYVGVFLSRM